MNKKTKVYYKIGDLAIPKKWRTKPFTITQIEGRYIWGVTTSGDYVGPFITDELTKDHG